MSELSHLKSVLVVEDDFLITMDVEQTLKHLGCQSIQSAASCAEALELVAASGFDLVTVDIKLSDGDCHDLTELLRQQGVPFVYITGFDGEDRAPHAAPMVSKPIDLGGLVDAVLSVTTPESCRNPARRGSCHDL